MKNEIRHTAHSTYRCQYHIVFAPKYRRKEIYGQLRMDIGQILRKLCEQKGAEILEATAMPDHIHMLLYLQEFTSIEHFISELHTYIKWYNTKRIKLKLDGMSPVEYRLAAA